MTADPLTIAPDAPVAEAVRIMLDRRVSGLPVVDSRGGLVGVITEGDLLRRSELGTEKRRARWLEFLFGPGKSAEEFVHSHGLKVEEVMTRTPITVAPTAGLDEVVDVMTERRIKRLMVVADGRLLGVVSRADLLRALSGAFAAAPIPLGTGSDADLKARIEQVLAEKSWMPVSSINVEVQARTVHLWGSILDERQREAIRVCVENVPGVAGIVDHLVWVEPFSGTVMRGPGEAVD
ncbi:CBS domain-containing protein [Siculibacillus lacustris]|nr:CBS domain-containing protein [Siculibacillus lacustris]